MHIFANASTSQTNADYVVVPDSAALGTRRCVASTHADTKSYRLDCRHKSHRPDSFECTDGLSHHPVRLISRHTGCVGLPNSSSGLSGIPWTRSVNHHNFHQSNDDCVASNDFADVCGREEGDENGVNWLASSVREIVLTLVSQWNNPLTFDRSFAPASIVQVYRKWPQLSAVACEKSVFLSLI